MNSPSASRMPSSITSATRAPVRTSTPRLTSRSRVASEIRGGSAGRILSRGFDQHDADVVLGIDLVEAVGDDLARCVVQFGGEFGAGRARADDGDMELTGADRLRLVLRAQAGVDEAAVEAAGLLRRFQRHRELGRAGRAEIVGDAADRDDERVIGEVRLRHDLAPLVVEKGRQRNGPGLAVQADHFAVAIVETMPVRLRQVIQLMLGSPEAAGRDRMQQRLPDMRAALIDQRDPRSLRLQAVAQLGREFQPAGAAADDHDMVRRRIGHVGHHRIEDVDNTPDDPGRIKSAPARLVEPPGSQIRRL